MDLIYSLLKGIVLGTAIGIVGIFVLYFIARFLFL